jgi:lipid II:glycine glycyltransferase (peptidoglycan interpeptide bridge formation enzyme)
LVIDLNQNKEDIFKGFRRFTRQRISKAYRSGIEVTTADNENDIHAFWKLYNALALEKQMRQIPELFFIKLWRNLIKDKENGVFLIARYQNEIVSGLIVLKHNTRAVAHYSASESKRFSKLAKSQATHWEAIQWAKQNHCAVYDLGGYLPGASEGSPLYGVNQFKRGFSKKRQDYVRNHLVIISPVRYRLLSWLERLKNGIR